VATRKPFKIQIQAAMDSSSASKMTSRLQALGYQAHMVPTRLNGSTWYRIEVGPYATQAEAAAAETELRQKYNSAYGRGGEPAQPADTDSDQGPEE
jgi:cell division septation protein DedD